MITVDQLIAHLKLYAAQSPRNSAAPVMLQCGDRCLDIKDGNNIDGMFPGEHALVLVPDLYGRQVIMRAATVQ